jgi:hypothetical protein
MSDNREFGSISAEDNILHAISLIDRSMSEMVSVEEGSLQDKFVAMRLQIDNLQAKCDHLLPDKDEVDDDDDIEFYNKIEDAKEEYTQDKQKNNISDLRATRKYFSSTLEAIYTLLAKKGVYQAVGEKNIEDTTIDPRDNEQ